MDIISRLVDAIGLRNGRTNVFLKVVGFNFTDILFRMVGVLKHFGSFDERSSPESFSAHIY